MANIVSLISNALVERTHQPIQQSPIRPIQGNPFAGENPFVNYNANKISALYAQNKPIQGGYFAGYHNGKPNIVGQRLFIEA